MNKMDMIEKLEFAKSRLAGVTDLGVSFELDRDDQRRKLEVLAGVERDLREVLAAVHKLKDPKTL